MKSWKLLASVVAVSVALFTSATASAATAELFASTGNLEPGAGSLAIDSSGNLYLGVFQNTTMSIAKVTPAGVITPQWGGALADYAGGIAVGPDGSVFAAYSTNTGMVKLNSSGAAVATYTYNSPTGNVAVDTTGNAYWTGRGPNRVGKIPAGEPSGSVPSQTITPSPGAIITDASGNVYVTTTSNTVLKFNSSLSQVATYSVGANPFALAVDSTYLYVANKDDGTVSRIRLSDGDTTAAWANLGLSGGVGPMSIAVDSSGNVYTANAGASPSAPGSISKITPTGSVSVLATLTVNAIAIVVDSANNVYFTR